MSRQYANHFRYANEPVTLEHSSRASIVQELLVESDYSWFVLSLDGSAVLDADWSNCLLKDAPIVSTAKRPN